MVFSRPLGTETSPEGGNPPPGEPNPPFEGVPPRLGSGPDERRRRTLELTPEQPQAVAEEVAAALEPGGAAPGPDPWWQAGIQEQLDQYPECTLGAFHLRHVHSLSETRLLRIGRIAFTAPLRCARRWRTASGG